MEYCNSDPFYNYLNYVQANREPGGRKTSIPQHNIPTQPGDSVTRRIDCSKLTQF